MGLRGWLGLQLGQVSLLSASSLLPYTPLLQALCLKPSASNPPPCSSNGKCQRVEACAHLSQLEALHAAGLPLGGMRLRGDATPDEPQAPAEGDGRSENTRQEYKSYKLRTLHRESEAQSKRSTHQQCECMLFGTAWYCSVRFLVLLGALSGTA